MLRVRIQVVLIYGFWAPKSLNNDILGPLGYANIGSTLCSSRGINVVIPGSKLSGAVVPKVAVCCSYRSIVSKVPIQFLLPRPSKIP